MTTTSMRFRVPQTRSVRVSSLIVSSVNKIAVRMVSVNLPFHSAKTWMLNMLDLKIATLGTAKSSLIYGTDLDPGAEQRVAALHDYQDDVASARRAIALLTVEEIPYFRGDNKHGTQPTSSNR